MALEPNVQAKTYQSAYSDIYLGQQDVALRYNSAISNAFETYIWELEKRFLIQIFEKIHDTTTLTYMDYACGTGRIVNYIGEQFQFQRIVGADSSAGMLEGARLHAPAGVEFLEMNLGDSASEVQEQFDVVSAFRLFLNLEDDNRKHILRGIHNVLRENGTFIVNNHMNRYSFKGFIAFVMHHVFGIPLKHQKKPGQRSVINTMSELEFRKLLSASGFVVEKVYRFGLLPGHKNILPLPQKILIPLELFLSQVPILNLFAKDQIYVCRRTS